MEKECGKLNWEEEDSYNCCFAVSVFCSFLIMCVGVFWICKMSKQFAYGSGAY